MIGLSEKGEKALQTTLKLDSDIVGFKYLRVLGFVTRSFG